MDQKNHKNRDELLLDRLRQIVLENLQNEQFGVEDLSREIGMSRSQLHRKLKKTAKKSISQFIREIRLEKAHELLKGNVGTVSEVSYRVGFSSPAYFSTSFKNYFGFPPGEAQIRDDSHQTTDTSLRPRPAKDRIAGGSSRKGLQILVVGMLLGLAALFAYYSLYKTSSHVDPPEDFEKASRSIAVLPLKNWSGIDSLEYVSDGLSDAVIYKIANVEFLEKVVPFTTMLSYKNTKKVITEIAEEQGVSHVLQGSFQLAGEQVKVALQLIDGKSDKQIWSDEFSGKWESNEIFLLQQKVARNVVAALDHNLSDQVADQIKEYQTQNFEAYKQFRLAEHQRYKYTPESFKVAIPYYEKALQLDSNFVEAYGRLAQIYVYQGLIWGVVNEEKAWADAKKLLERAFQIDPDDPYINEQLYNGYLYYGWNFDELKKRMESDLENPQFNRLNDLTFDFKIKMGYYEDALQSINTRISVNPNGNNFGKKAELLFTMGDLQACDDLLAENDALWDDGFYLRESAKWHFYLGNIEDSQRQLERVKQGFDTQPPIVLWLDAVLGETLGKD